MCPAAVNTKVQLKEFVDTAVRYIATRLNGGAPGANLTAQDAYAIMHLCPFDTVAKEMISPFCGLFSEEDFNVYEYAGDLAKFYNTGYAYVVSPSLAMLIVCLSAMEAPWVPSKASDTSTSLSDASRIPPRDRVHKPTLPYSHPLRRSLWTGRYMSTSPTTT